MVHVFVSYVRENEQRVDRLASDLKRAGIGVWLDKHQIKPGQRWQNVIAAAIREGTHFLACFSKAYQERDRTHMNEELALAVEELKKRPHDRAWFLPVRLDDCRIPARSIGGNETLLDIQWVDLHKNWSRGLQELIGALGPHYITPEEREKAERRERAKTQLSRDERLIKALLDIRSKDSSMKLEAAREFRELRDPRTIPTLVEVMGKETVPTPTKITLMRALREFGANAVPCLIDEIHEWAGMVSEVEGSEGVNWEEWRASVLKSDAGRLLVGIGAACIPSLHELRNDDKWLHEAADALLAAIEKGQ